MAQGYRPDRVGDQIRKELSEMLARGSVHDPGIGFITLTTVKVSPDLQQARVFYTTLGDPKARIETARALERATPFFRRQIGGRLRLRRVPEIEFRFDEAIQHQDRIEQVLRDLREEEAERAAPADPDPGPARTPRDAVTDAGARAQAALEIRKRQRFVVASHVRPDGDAIGSQLAMAYALRGLGKEVRVVSRDPWPPMLSVFPGVSDIEIVERVDDPGDAVIVMESGDLLRTGVAGLDPGFIINIDHHVGNTMFGAVNWLDLSAAACGEMVFDLVRDLGVPLTYEIALHVYIAILTDTGSFHYSNITPRTFDICRQCVDAGVSPPAVARSIFDSSSLGRLKLFGAVLSRMQIDDTGRLATVSVDQQLAADCGGTYDDTEGLINIPLTVKEVQAVLFFREIGPGDWRVSMRSKGHVDINAVAREFGGGGHKNASGCSATGRFEDLRKIFQQKITEQIDNALVGSS